MALERSRAHGNWEMMQSLDFWYLPTEHVSINYSRSGFSFADDTKTGVSSELVSLRIYMPLNMWRSPLRPYAEGGVGRYTGKVLVEDVDEVNGLFGGVDWMCRL